MRPIADIRKEGEELGYRDADLREFVKDQQALEREREIADRAERAAVRQQQKLDAETEQKKIDAAQEQTRLEIKAAREKEKREAEIAAEEKRMTAEEKKREADMAMERERREAELQLRKMAMEEEKMRIEAGQNTDSRRTSTSGNGFSAKVPRLPVFHDNKDNIGAYIERFERFATTHHWPRETWASSLSALITGKALEVYSRLSADEADDFDVLKKALLDRYNLNAEGFRMKLRDSVADEGESPAQFITRLDSYLNKWIELSKIPKTFAGMVQLVLTEQFTSTCSNDLATFLKERTCGSLKDLGETANKYLEAHGKQMKDASKKTNTSRSQNSSSGKPTCSYCHRMGHVVKECKAKKQAESSDSQQQGSSRVECWACGKKGHMFRECKKWDGDREAAGVGIDRRNVKCFLCSQMGHISSNCPEKWKKSEKVGCSQEYEDREIDTEVGATALVSEVSDEDTSDEDIEISNVIWTRNKGEMPVYRGKVGKHSVQTLRDTGCSCVVVKRKFVKDGQLTGKTRAVIQMLGTSARLPVAKIDIDTPYLKGEVEALCAEDSLYDLIIGNVEGAREPRDPNPEWEEGGAMETRAQKKKTMGNRPLKVKDCQDEDITPEEYLKRQQEDRSLDRLRSSEERRQQGKSISWFQTEGGILYRMFQNPHVNSGNPVKQVVVPKILRTRVMSLAHDSILGGHLGVKKTTDKVLSNFFWPGIGGDVKRYCRSCDICQRTVPKGKNIRVPLEKPPVIETPFKRVSFDLVGEIKPASQRGYRYILTAVDHASRYPEAVALKRIDTETVAEAMVDIFSRVGVPQEILHDQGTQFMSEVMKEVSRLLSMKQLTSTPYHPICNGLVEKFNGTMKQMLRRLCDEEPRDWDRYINAMLFAYREVPQESTGFSPFELLYGRSVRGPMQILRNLWTKEQQTDDVRNSYQYVVDLRGRIEKTLRIAHKNLREAQGRYKHHYDKRSRPRRLKTGDEVLVLLPTNQNKLLMQWKGPYPVTEIVGVNDYRVKVKGKNKTYHINLLKEYVSRKEGAVEESQSMMELAGAAVIEYEEGKVESVIDEEQLLDTRRTSEKETYKDVKISSKLSASQKRDMKNLVFQYRDVFTDKPGTTNLAEHKIEMVTDDPVRVKPYPIPYSLREELKQDIEQMLDMGVIRKSDSPYSSPIVIVRKKDGSNRICIDFRRVNKLSRFDSEPMIRPQDIFSRISQDKYYSKFDMTKGYWQIPMRKQDIAKTSFVTPDGCYEFVKMPFGLMNSGATFTRMMRRLLEGVRNVEHYIDDCLVHTESWEQHMETLREFLGRVRRAKLTVRPSKCEMGFENMEFVGHEVKKGEIGLHADNIKKIREAPRPKTKTQVRSFLGLTGFYRGYIDKYAEIAEPLTDLTKKKSPNVIKWGETQEKAFSILKRLLVAEPILRLPDMTKPFLLRTDASDAGIGAVLLQQHEGKLFPVAYASKKLLPRERNYSIMEKECLAVVWAVKRFNVYLYGAPFVLQTDHQPLAYLNRAKFTNGRITRWALFLQPYSITIEAIKGSQNVGADYMSRV